jgi:hypothetical protein
VGSECRTNSLNPKRSYHSVSGLLEFLPVAGSTVHLCSHGPFLGMLVVLTDITYELVTGEGKDFSFCSPGDVMVLCWAPAPFCLVLVVCLFRGDTLLTGEVCLGVGFPVSVLFLGLDTYGDNMFCIICEVNSVAALAFDGLCLQLF